MTKNKILLTFKYCRDGDLIKITRRILDSLKDNANFPNLSSTLDAIEKALQEYTAALSNAGGRDREMASIKDDKRAVLRELLMDLAYAITQISKTDKSMLLGSGFDISERAAAARRPAKLEVRLDGPGEATISIKGVRNVKAYMHQYAADPITDATIWASELTSSNEHTFTELVSTSRVWFRIIVLTKDGEKTTWDPVQRVIQ